MIGIHHDIAAARYHADDFGPEPTLSSSIAKLLLDEAPIKAWRAHPRLGHIVEDADPSRVKEIGTAAHKLILGRGCDVVVIEAADYRKDVVKQQRADAYEAGYCPILAADAETAQAIAENLRAGIGALPDCGGFLGGQPEVVVIADDPSGARLRIMIDMLELRGDDTAIIWDVKTGDQSAAPHTLGGRVTNMGMDLQAEFYRRVLQLAMPGLRKITHRFLFAENDAPHLFMPAEIDATAREMGRRKTAYAIAMWNRCLSTNDWPGYPAQIVVPDYPAYAETKWLAREEAFAAMGIDAFAHEPVPYTAPRSLAGAC